MWASSSSLGTNIFANICFNLYIINASGLGVTVESVGAMEKYESNGSVLQGAKSCVAFLVLGGLEDESSFGFIVSIWAEKYLLCFI